MSLWKRKRIEEFEEVEYEPLTVLEILTEMKDLSELTVDLAYSALVLDSDPIAEQVEDLAARMDWLKYQLRIMGSLGVRTTEEAEQVGGILQIGEASESIANVASDMVELLDANVAMRPFLGKILDEADDRVGTLRVPAGCHASGQTFGDLQISSEVGVRILAIKRAKKWIYRPGAENKFQDEDLLLIRGQREGADHLKRWLAGEEDEL